MRLGCRLQYVRTSHSGGSRSLVWGGPNGPSFVNPRGTWGGSREGVPLPGWGVRGEAPEALEFIDRCAWVLVYYDRINDCKFLEFCRVCLTNLVQIGPVIVPIHFVTTIKRLNEICLFQNDILCPYNFRESIPINQSINKTNRMLLFYNPVRFLFSSFKYKVPIAWNTTRQK